MGQIKKLAGQTLIYGGTNMAARFINYLLVPLYTYYFSPEQYGIVSELYAYVAFLQVLLTFGMETAYFRFSQKNDEPVVYSQSLLFVSLISVGFIIVVILLRDWLHQLLSNGLDVPYKTYVVWFACILAIDAISAIPLARLRLQNRPVKFALIKMTNILCNVLFNLFFILWLPRLHDHYGGIWSKLYDPSLGVGYIFLSNLLASFVLLISLWPQIKTARLILNRPLISKMIHYGWPLAVMGLAGIVNETIDRPMIKYLSPGEAQDKLAQVGIYGACYKIAILMSIIIQAYRYAADPFFFQKSKDSDHKEVYALVMKYFVKVMLFVALGIVANLSWIGYFVGEEYRTGLVIVPWLILANFFLGVYFNLSVWYKLTDKTIYGSLLAIAGALLTLILNYMLIPEVGYTGAAITTFVCYFTMALVSYFLGQKYFRVPYDIKSFLVEFALFMVAMVYIWQNPHFLANSWIHLLWKNLILVLFGVFLWQRTTRDKHQSIL